MVFSKICGLLACLVTVAVSTHAWYQNPYGAGVLNAAPSPNNLGFNNAPKSTINHLSSIGDSEFTALSHSQFPNHRVRIKKSNFCDPTVKLALSLLTSLTCADSFSLSSVYTGYLDVDAGAKHMFFYFFESRRDPEKGIGLCQLIKSSLMNLSIDDVMMWINGGLSGLVSTCRSISLRRTFFCRPGMFLFHGPPHGTG